MSIVPYFGGGMIDPEALRSIHIPHMCGSASGGRMPMMSPVPVEEREQDDWQFYAEAIQAWRAWRVIDWDGVLTLQSITYKVNWIPRQEMIAECKVATKVPTAPHPAPDIDHGCGIYSVKEATDVEPWVRHCTPREIIIFGRVSIWGHCYRFTKGYLSEFAYPAQLKIPMWRPGPPDGKMDIDITPEELSVELSTTYRVEAVIDEYPPYSKKNSQTSQRRSNSDDPQQ